MKIDSLSNQQVNYKLEALINNAVPKEEIRIQKINKIPFCIVYGDVSQTICDTLEKELNMQVGSESARILCHIRRLADAQSCIDTAFQDYRENVEKGNALLLENYMFFILFTADSFRAEEMQGFLQIIKGKCRQKGIGENYDLAFYCIFDYEAMDGIPLKEEMDAFFRGSGYSLGIITPNSTYHTEFQKYWKGLQAIVLHIFLRCSDTDGNHFSVRQENACPYFTLGYWKLDVLKQLLTDYFIAALEKQNRPLEKAAAHDLVAAAIDQVAEFDNNWWMDQFEKMPILYAAEVEEIFKVKWMGIRKTRINCRELLEQLYGRADAFTCFLKNNLEAGAEQELLDRFFGQQIGNYYFVKNQLSGILQDIYKEYDERHKNICQQEYLINKSIVIDKQSTITDILQMFRKTIWVQEGAVFACARKLHLIDRIQEYLESSEFQERLEAIARRNHEQCNQLKVLRREIAWKNQKSAFAEPAILCGEGFNEKLLWQDNLLDEEVLHHIQLSIKELQQKVQCYIEQNTDEVLNTFLSKIEILKQDNKLELFYAARLNLSYESKEREYLYLNAKYHNMLDLSYRLPHLSIQGRQWQSGSCMELFCTKEINDLAQIYNMS